MNIVYAVKIFASLVIVLYAMRVIAGKGLRLVMTPSDWQAAWPAVVGTLFVSCFSWRTPLFFVVFSVWALCAPRLFGKSGDGRLPAYVLLACVSPQFSMELENIGPLRDLLRLDAFRIIEIFILLPAMIRIMTTRDRPARPAWLVVCDLATFGYFVYWTLHLYGQGNASSLARETLGALLDTWLPYYVLSRACLQADMRRRVMSMMLFGAAYECLVGVAEGLSRHLLYAQLQYLYGDRWNVIGALTRGSWVRAQAAFPGPLVLAVLALFGVGLWLALKPAVKSRAYTMVALVLVGGMLATFSRGPVLALLVLFVGVTCLRYMSARRFLVLAAVLAIALAASWNLGLGDAVVGAVNGITGADRQADFNVIYRQQLLKTSLALIQQSPWFGVPDYMQYMQDLRQGDGIIDLVNTYLVIALNVGLCGLLLFLLPYAIALWKLASGIAQAPEELRRESLAWLPLTVAILVVVFTVSPVSIIRAILIWVVALALARLQDRAPAVRVEPLVPAEPPAQPPPQFAVSSLVSGDSAASLWQ